jgi:hypothetical protein
MVSRILIRRRPGPQSGIGGRLATEGWTMRVTKLTIIGTTGVNKRPTFGQVTFADGRTYFWSRDVVDGGIVFSGSRRFFIGTPSAYSHSFSFFAPKRAAAVETYLAGLHVEGTAL